MHEIWELTVLIGDSKTSFTHLNRSYTSKFSKTIPGPNNMADQLDLPDIYNSYSPTKKAIHIFIRGKWNLSKLQISFNSTNNNN